MKRKELTQTGFKLKKQPFDLDPFFKKIFQRFKGHVSDYCGEIITDKPPIMYCMDDTKPDGSHPALMGLILGNEARQLQHLSKERRLYQHSSKTHLFTC